MNDQSNVRLVDAHAERVRCDNRANLLRHERFLHLVTPRIVESGVIPGGADLRAFQYGREVINCAPRRGIDHCQSISGAQDFDEPFLLFSIVLRRHDVVREIRPIEAGDDGLRVLECQLPNDVAPNFGCCRRRQSNSCW